MDRVEPLQNICLVFTQNFADWSCLLSCLSSITMCLVSSLELTATALHCKVRQPTINIIQFLANIVIVVLHEWRKPAFSERPLLTFLDPLQSTPGVYSQILSRNNIIMNAVQKHQPCTPTPGEGGGFSKYISWVDLFDTKRFCRSRTFKMYTILNVEISVHLSW